MPTASRDRMGGLAKGLQLIESFDSAHTRMTLSEAGRRTGISPAAARRCLLTLCELGYVCTDGKLFWIGTGALRFAYAYAASTRLARVVQPALDCLCELTLESAALCVLDEASAVIVARSSARRTMRVGSCTGTRLPLYCSAAGRVLMADMAREDWQSLAKAVPMHPLTPRTVTAVIVLDDLLRQCRASGHASCDEEIELGVRSVAVPLHDRSGKTVAALSLSARAERLTLSELQVRFLPAMKQAQDWVKTRA